MKFGAMILLCCCAALLASCISDPPGRLCRISRDDLAVEFLGEKVKEFPYVSRIDVVFDSGRETYVPQNAGSLGLYYYLTNCVSPDGRILVLPIGLTEGLGVFRVDKGLLDKIRQRKPDDRLRMWFIEPDSGRYVPTCIYFKGWDPPSKLTFVASADDYNETCVYDCANGAIIGPTNAVFKRSKIDAKSEKTIGVKP